MTPEQAADWITDQGYELSPYNVAERRYTLSTKDAEALMGQLLIMFGERVHMNQRPRRYPALFREGDSSCITHVVWVPEGYGGTSRSISSLSHTYNVFAGVIAKLFTEVERA